MAINSTPGFNRTVAFREAQPSLEDRLATIENRLGKQEAVQKAQTDVNLDTFATLTQLVINAKKKDPTTPLYDLAKSLRQVLEEVPANSAKMQQLKDLKDFNYTKNNPLNEIV